MYPLILLYIPIKCCSLLENCGAKFLNVTWTRDYITWHVGIVERQCDVFSSRLVKVAFVRVTLWRFQFVMWPRDQSLWLRSCHCFIISAKVGPDTVSFLKLCHNNIKNWYFKVRQLLLNDTKNRSRARYLRTSFL